MLESVSTLYLRRVDHELTNLSRLNSLKTLVLDDCGLEVLPHMGKQMEVENLTVDGCRRLRGWDGVGKLGLSDSQSGVDLQCDWTLPHLLVLVWRDSGEFELPDLSHFPRLKTFELDNVNKDPTKFALHCRASHLQLETLSCYNSQITKLPDLGKFPRLRKLTLNRCDKLPSLTISCPLTALKRFEVFGCNNLNVLPSVDLFPGLRYFKVMRCGVKLDGHEIVKLRARGFNFGSDESWVLSLEPSSDEVVFEGEPKLNSDEQVALKGANDVAGPSWREVDSSPHSVEFVPYDESTTECSPVSKRARLQ